MEIVLGHALIRKAEPLGRFLRRLVSTFGANRQSSTATNDEDIISKITQDSPGQILRHHRQLNIGAVVVVEGDSTEWALAVIAGETEYSHRVRDLDLERPLQEFSDLRHLFPIANDHIGPPRS